MLVTMCQLLVSAVGGGFILVGRRFIGFKYLCELDNLRSFIFSAHGLAAVLPLGICHAVGFLATNLSLGLDDMSFHHSIKAAEPLFTSILSFVILGQRTSLFAYSALAPIMLGIVLCTAGGLQYSTMGLLYALASNACFSLRSVVATAVLRPRRTALADHRRSAPPARLGSFPLYVLMSAAAAAILAAVFLATELRSAASGSGGPAPPPPPSAAPPSVWGRVDGRERGRTAAQLLAAGALHLLYNAASFQARPAAAWGSLPRCWVGGRGGGRPAVAAAGVARSGGGGAGAPRRLRGRGGRRGGANGAVMAGRFGVRWFLGGGGRGAGGGTGRDGGGGSEVARIGEGGAWEAAESLVSGPGGRCWS